MSNLPTLYKRTATGAIQEWRQELDGNRYRTISGQQGGQHVTSEWTVCEGKNVGRSNETTPDEQAESEVRSNYTKKLAQGGYHESVDTIDKPKFFKPMLAQKYEDRIPTPEMYQDGLVYSQPKLDGIRCIVTVDGMWTRQGKPILSAPHVREQLSPLFEVDDALVLDGELYSDPARKNFNEIISMVRKSKPTAEDLSVAAEHVEYWVYDLPSHDAVFSERWEVLREMVEALDGTAPATILTPTVQARDEEHTLELFLGYDAGNMEGQIVRIDLDHYEQKRSKRLLKRKTFMDEEFQIVRIEEGVGNRSGMAGRVVCLLPDGREFSASMKGTHDYCREVLTDAEIYPGGQVTVKFFEYTPDGVPRFPVAIQLYEGQRDV